MSTSKIFNFDNADIGEINKYIKYKEISNENKLYKIELNIQDNLNLLVHDYKNDFPLIIDEMKGFFSICSTYYNIVTIDDKKYLVSKYVNDISFRKYKEYNKNKISYERDVKKMLIFNWLMCVNDLSLNIENKFLVRPLLNYKVADTLNSNFICVCSTNEKGFHYLNTKEYEAYNNPPSTIIKEWFDNSIEKFYEFTKNMVCQIDSEKLRMEATNIVNKYDKDYISWVNSMYNRVRDVKNALVS
jgi:hypothetical protein